MNNIILRLQRYNTFWWGFTLGLITPVLTIIITYFNVFTNYTIKEFIHFLIMFRVLTKLLSLCVVPNLGVFFLFIWPNFLKAARGTLAATFLLAFVVVIIQIVIKAF